MRGEGGGGDEKRREAEEKARDLGDGWMGWKLLRGLVEK